MAACIVLLGASMIACRRHGIARLDVADLFRLAPVLHHASVVRRRDRVGRSVLALDREARSGDGCDLSGNTLPAELTTARASLTTAAILCPRGAGAYGQACYQQCPQYPVWHLRYSAKG
jgi:hypothetical protein